MYTYHHIRKIHSNTLYVGIQKVCFRNYYVWNGQLNYMYIIIRCIKNDICILHSTTSNGKRRRPSSCWERVMSSSIERVIVRFGGRKFDSHRRPWTVTFFTTGLHWHWVLENLLGLNYTRLDRSRTVHIQIALDLDRSQINQRHHSH